MATLAAPLLLLSSLGEALPALDLALCPQPSHLGSRVPPGARAVSLTLKNQMMANLELLYTDEAGREKRYWVVDARGSFSVSTREGDVWRLRTKTRLLAAEIQVAQVDEAGLEQTVVIEPCLPREQEAEYREAMQHDVLSLLKPANLAACNPWAQLSSSEPSPGGHVACVLLAPDADTETAFTLAVFPDGWTGGTPSTQKPMPTVHIRVPFALLNASDVALLLMRRLGVPKRGPLHQLPAIFTATGKQLESVAELSASISSGGCVLIFEGGQWVWPAIEIGYQRHLLIDDGRGTRNVSLTTVSLWPRALVASDFLGQEEADLIISRAQGHMFKSQVRLKTADAGHAAAEYRTSSQWSFPLWDDSVMPLDRRVQLLTRVPLTHAEQIQVLRYEEWEHYTAHHDFFDPGEYRDADREEEYANNRMATVLFFLNQPARGGETGFVRAGKLSQPRDFLDCNRGVAVAPEARAVLIFYSMLPNGEFDQTSLHAGCDVKKGTKWAANFWLWNKPKQNNPTAIRLSQELRTAPPAMEIRECDVAMAQA